jgi:dihydroneopterin aldolase
MGLIKLDGMEFYAYHGCYPEEQLAGGRFTVNLSMETDMKKASESDDLNDALDYAGAYELVKQEMNIRSNLLEHVCGRILNRLFDHFGQLVSAEVRITKLNPPLDGQVRGVCVVQQKKR